MKKPKKLAKLSAETEIEKLIKQLERAEKQAEKDPVQISIEVPVTSIYALYQAFIKVGFTTEQSFQLTHTVVNNTVK